MKRIFRIYKAILLRSFAEDVIFRGNFVNNIIASLSWSALAVFSIILIFSNFKEINGWTLNEALVIGGVFIIEKDLVIAIFRSGLKKVPQLIISGELDSLLLKPIDSQIYVSLIKVITAHLLTPFVGTGVILYSLQNTGRNLSLLSVTVGAGMVFVSVLFIYSLVLFFTAFNFHFLGIDNIFDLPWSLYRAAQFPDSAYRGLGLNIFLSLLPLTLTTTVPAQVILGSLSLTYLTGLILFTSFSLLASRFFWKTSVKKYTSAGG